MDEAITHASAFSFDMLRVAILGVAVLLAAERAEAWSRPGHMVSAAIAWRDLETEPAVRSTIADLLEAHPDRAPFEVAIDRTTGEARLRRMFYECARWPDDARGTSYDHPTWHYAAIGFTRDGTRVPTKIVGSAIEAFALNAAVVRDRNASKAERAVALCWVMHLVGDIHQPLHTAQLYSSEFPNGDRLGSLHFVREKQDAAPVTLHWFWDDLVHRSGTSESVEARAEELLRHYPHTTEIVKIEDFAAWGAEESHGAAITLAYNSSLLPGPDPLKSALLPSDYQAEARLYSEQRIVVAGHRLASVLKVLLDG